MVELVYGGYQFKPLHTDWLRSYNEVLLPLSVLKQWKVGSPRSCVTSKYFSFLTSDRLRSQKPHWAEVPKQRWRGSLCWSKGWWERPGLGSYNVSHRKGVREGQSSGSVSVEGREEDSRWLQEVWKKKKNQVAKVTKRHAGDRARLMVREEPEETSETAIRAWRRWNTPIKGGADERAARGGRTWTRWGGQHVDYLEVSDPVDPLHLLVDLPGYIFFSMKTIMHSSMETRNDVIVTQQTWFLSANEISP